ncbi:MAG: hypothetical protein M0C28_42030 [Candidatus Moduliflexus flocculans]|nr:hypothetical protein [Candidatus Moduliflexus flocculans]
MLSSDVGVKGVIDVFRKKSEPLVKNAVLTALLNEVDESGFAWGAVSVPPELVKKGVESDPLFKALQPSME